MVVHEKVVHDGFSRFPELLEEVKNRNVAIATDKDEGPSVLELEKSQVSLAHVLFVHPNLLHHFVLAFLEVGGHRPNHLYELLVDDVLLKFAQDDFDQTCHAHVGFRIYSILAFQGASQAFLSLDNQNLE